MVRMDPAAFALVEGWPDLRRQQGLSLPIHVFCMLTGRPLQASYVRAMLPRLAREAGIDKCVHAFGLRHICAAELGVEGTPVSLVQQQLVHASLHSTTVYLRFIAPVELVATIRRRTWTAEGSSKGQA